MKAKRVCGQPSALVRGLTDNCISADNDSGPPPCGNCLISNGTAGGDEQNCEAAIGVIDPFCIEIFWDGICAYEAMEYCVDVYCEADDS